MSEPPMTVIRPRRGWHVIDLRELWRYRELLAVLALREIQVRYKQTILGVVWAILQPLMTAGVFAVLFGLLLGRGNEPGVGGVAYGLSTFCAMLPWQFFANSLSQAGNSLVSNQRLVTKVYFPRAIVPLAAVLGALADFFIALLALGAMMVWWGTTPTWRVAFLPGFVLMAVVASIAAGLWFSAATALYRDFRYVVPFVVQIGLFISPVIYTADRLRGKLPDWALLIYGLNPMAGAIEGFRWSLLPGAAPPGSMLVVSVASALLLLAGGALHFRSMERWFADLV